MQAITCIYRASHSCIYQANDYMDLSCKSLHVLTTHVITCIYKAYTCNDHERYFFHSPFLPTTELAYILPFLLFYGECKSRSACTLRAF